MPSSSILIQQQLSGELAPPPGVCITVVNVMSIEMHSVAKFLSNLWATTRWNPVFVSSHININIFIDLLKK